MRFLAINSPYKRQLRAQFSRGFMTCVVKWRETMTRGT